MTTYRLYTQFFLLLTLFCHLSIRLWCCILHLKGCILQQKVYELESSVHFQPSCAHSFLLLAHSTILSFVCRPSVTLHTVVKANKTTTITSIIVLGRHWKEPETTATMMMVTTAVQTTIVTSRSRVTMITAAKTAVTTTTTGVCNIENDTGSN